jgi:hypothetical protein
MSEKTSEPERIEVARQARGEEVFILLPIGLGTRRESDVFRLSIIEANAYGSVTDLDAVLKILALDLPLASQQSNPFREEAKRDEALFDIDAHAIITGQRGQSDRTPHACRCTTRAPPTERRAADGQLRPSGAIGWVAEERTCPVFPSIVKMLLTRAA